MFVDVSVFEVEDGMRRIFERDFGAIVVQARESAGCVSSELVRLTEARHYVWIERWETKEQHDEFTEILFGQLLPNLPDFGRYATRVVDRDVEGHVVI